MHTLTATASSSLSLPTDSYIYSIAPSAAGTFSAISSDDSLRVFDAASLSHVSLVTGKSHDHGVTALTPCGGGNQPLLATGGRDGKVRLWDSRHANGLPVVEMQTERNDPVLSVACSPETNTIVAGTELASSQAVAAFWDIRSPARHSLQYVESHNDDITELQFHPSRTNILLSGSTDGLVNVYNTSIRDEDDALVQVINHGSVHHAGFLSETTIYALSHDEVFSIYPATDPDAESVQEPAPTPFGDLRQPLACEYVAQLCLGSLGQAPHVAAGNKAENRLDLVPLDPSPAWHFDHDNLWRLPGAHGEEVVRSVYLDEQTRTVFTGGEDGLIRAWKPNGEEPQPKEEDEEEGGVSTRPKKQKKKDRFKPY